MTAKPRKKPGPKPRPASEIRRAKWTVWVNRDEARQIQAAARAAGLTVGEYLRAAALGNP